MWEWYRVCAPADFEGVAMGVVRSGSPTGNRPEAVRVWLLGGFRVSVGSRTIEQGAWRLKKAASLIKLLALSPGHRLHREQVMDLLWPDSGRKAASNSLRKTLHAARRLLDPAAGSSYLASEDESLVLCPKNDLWVDVEAFQEAAAAARRAQEPAAYRAAVDLYAGELLPEDRYEQWAEGRREELRRTFLSLLIELAGIYEQRGEYGPAVEKLQRAVTEEPILEEAHAGLMRLHALSGRRRDALQHYERLREVLSRELAAEPDATTRQLREDIAAGRFPPAQPTGPPRDELPDSGKHNLPAPRTSFVGRDHEMVEIKRALSMTRLLTLTGAGGSGKTRLALEVARELVGAYSDGVWLVELAPLSEGGLVSQAVAATLGVQEQPSRPLADTLTEALRAKQMSLVLDNCEHVVNDAAQLVDILLDSCPRLRVLGTSRKALGVVGEVVWRVPPLSLPDTQHLSTVEELEGYESARLFAERARQRDLSFVLTPHSAGAVAEICRRLDGIPLALELAAARVGTLSVEQISERLEDSLKFLTGGGRTVAPRQRTLRGALDWSHELLSSEEQALLRRLSVFAGGWTLEAAEAVGEGDGIEKEDILDMLSRLVDKSLIVTEVTGDGAVRYRMLEPVWQYAREKLEQSGESEPILRQHSAFFLALAEEAETELAGERQEGCLARLEREHDNLRAALSWVLGQRNSEVATRLAGALWRFWWMHGYLEEGLRWLERALALPTTAPVAARAKVLRGAGSLASARGDDALATLLYEEGLSLSRELGDMDATSRALHNLGVVLRQLGDYDRATGAFEESLALSRELNDEQGVAFSLGGLGEVAHFRGDYESARDFYEKSLALHRKFGDRHSKAIVLNNLGEVANAQGDHERAVPLAQESLVLFRELGGKLGTADALLTLVDARLKLGDHQRARALIRDSLFISLELGNGVVAAEGLDMLAKLSVAREDHARAARLLGAANGLHESAGAAVPPYTRSELERCASAARARLDQAEWEAAWKEGRTMSLKEAVGYALSEEETVIASSQAPDQPLGHEQPPALTHREQEVAELVARGLTNRRIAEELFLSERTVHRHVSSVLKKLGVPSREQVAAEWLSGNCAILIRELQNSD